MNSEIPESLRHYIDYESMARDMTLNGDVFAIEAAGSHLLEPLMLRVAFAPRARQSGERKHSPR